MLQFAKVFYEAGHFCILPLMFLFAFRARNHSLPALFSPFFVECLKYLLIPLEVLFLYRIRNFVIVILRTKCNIAIGIVCWIFISLTSRKLIIQGFKLYYTSPRVIDDDSQC